MINIGCATDNNYAPHLGVMLYSLLSNSNRPSEINIYIIDGGILEGNKDKLLGLQNEFGCNINFVIPDLNYFKNIKILPHFGIATYFRLFLVNNISVEKLIFLDCDMIVLDDVFKLLNYGFDGKPIIAVKDYFGSAKHYKKLNVTRYFNAGFMIIDVPKWNELKISERSIKFLQENIHLCEFADQDALNAVIKDSWTEADCKWNMVARMGLIKYGITKADIPADRRDEIAQASTNPSIIHYANRLFKPWNWLDPIPYKKEYQYYKTISPWKDLKETDKNFMGAVKRIKYYFTFTFKFLKKKYSV